MAKKISKAYYLLPILFGILGGIAAYLLLEDRDRKMAKQLLILGILMPFIWAALILALVFLAILPAAVLSAFLAA